MNKENFDKFIKDVRAKNNHGYEVNVLGMFDHFIEQARNELEEPSTFEGTDNPDALRQALQMTIRSLRMHRAVFDIKMQPPKQK